MKPLEGMIVLDFSQYLAGPSAALRLADLGARVIKIERPGSGDGSRPMKLHNLESMGDSVLFQTINRNKESFCANLKSPEDMAMVKRLIARADVMIENFRPGVMKKMGLDYESVRRINPRLVYGTVTGYGTTGPWIKKPGQDLLIQSMSGLVSLTGSDPEAPSPVGTPVVDQHGAVLAALGVVASVYDRARTGKGHKVEASLLGSALDLQQEALGYYLNGGQFTERPTTGLSTRFHQSPYGVYRTGDGCITLSLVPVEKLRELFTPGCLDGYTSRDQMERRLEFDAVVCREMKKKTTGEWKKIFDENGIWYAPVNNYQEVLEDEQVRYNDNILTMHHPVAGDVRVVGHANRYDGENIKIRKLPPKLGESTKILMEHLGYNEETIRRYREHGIITMEE